jgi:hypothetical protein
MLMSDLYHHLQGEIVGGRPLPAGPFQQIAAFLLTKETELVGLIGNASMFEGLHPAYGNGYLYDTKALEAELGLEWWPQRELSAFCNGRMQWRAWDTRSYLLSERGQLWSQCPSLTSKE